jgi:RNA polymerase sigma-70 factor (ECF subfamily)
MGSASDETSLTLLNLLCAPEKDETAWRVFVERYEPLIRHWCIRQRLQAADVEDVCQTVLQRVFTRISTYDPGRGGFRGWLKTVVANAVKDFLRTRGRRPGEQGAGGTEGADILQALAQPETVDSLVQELDTGLRRDLEEILARVEKVVEPDTMRAFRWTLLEGRSIADVAAQLGKSYAAVCMAVNRVKNKLREEGAKLGRPPHGATEDQP